MVVTLIPTCRDAHCFQLSQINVCLRVSIPIGWNEAYSGGWPPSIKIKNDHSIGFTVLKSGIRSVMIGRGSRTMSRTSANVRMPVKLFLYLGPPYSK